MPTIARLANVVIPFADLDRALEFYTEVLGLEKRVDAPFGDGYRWIEVAPAGAETTIALCPPGQGSAVGGRETGISLLTDDVDAHHAVLKQRGVDVDESVSRFEDAVPPMFWFRDPERNVLLVVQSR